MAPGYPTKKRDDALREGIVVLERKVVNLERLILVMGEKGCLQNDELV